MTSLDMVLLKSTLLERRCMQMQVFSLLTCTSLKIVFSASNWYRKEIVPGSYNTSKVPPEKPTYQQKCPISSYSDEDGSTAVSLLLYMLLLTATRFGEVLIISFAKSCSTLNSYTRPLACYSLGLLWVISFWSLRFLQALSKIRHCLVKLDPSWLLCSNGHILQL